MKNADGKISNGPLTISITPGSILAAAAIVLGIWLLFFLKALVLIVITAVVIASAIEPGVLWFIRRGAPRALSVAVIYLIVVALLFGGAYSFLPPLLDEVTGFAALASQYIGEINLNSLFSNQIISSTKAVVSTGSVTDALLQFRDILNSTSGGAFRAISSVFGGVFSFLLVMVLSIYFALQETGIDDFLRIVTPVKHQKYVLSLWKRSQIKIGLWMQGQLLLSLIVGVLVYLWLTILGVPYAFLLAVFSAAAELIPVFGSFIATVPALILAFSSGGITMLVLVLGGYLVINLLQANLMYPLVVKKVVGVPPLLVILALIAGAQLAGFLGVLLSVPIAAAVQELVNDVIKGKERDLARTANQEE